MLSRFAVSDEVWARYTSQRAAKRKTQVPEPQFVTVTGHDVRSNSEIERSLEAKVLNRPLDFPLLDRELTRFVGFGTLNAAGYSIKERNGEPGLSVTAYPKEYGPPFLNFGVTIDGADTEDVLFGMEGRLTFINLGGYRAEWRTDAFFGYSYGVKSEYYRPFTAESRWFYAPRAYATNTRFDFYNEGSQISQYEISQNGFGFDLGYMTPRRIEIRVGQDLYWYSVTKRIDYDDLLDPTAAAGGVFPATQLHLWGADNSVLPLAGVNTSLRLERHERSDGSEPFSQAEGRIASFYPITKSDSLMLIASGGTSFGASTDVVDLQGFSLGGVPSVWARMDATSCSGTSTGSSRADIFAVSFDLIRWQERDYSQQPLWKWGTRLSKYQSP